MARWAQKTTQNQGSVENTTIDPAKWPKPGPSRSRILARVSPSEMAAADLPATHITLECHNFEIGELQSQVSEQHQKLESQGAQIAYLTTLVMTLLSQIAPPIQQASDHVTNGANYKQQLAAGPASLPRSDARGTFNKRPTVAVSSKQTSAGPRMEPKRQKQQCQLNGAPAGPQGKKGPKNPPQPPKTPPPTPPKTQHAPPQQRRPLPASSPTTPTYNEFLKELKELQKNGVIKPPTSRLTIKRAYGDLVRANEQFKAQALAADFRCSAGIAKYITDLYRIKPQHPNPQLGTIVPMEVAPHSTFLNVVTKMESHDKIHEKPDEAITGVRLGVRNLLAFCKQEGIKELAVPYMCSGLDQIPAVFIEQLYYDECGDYEMNITIYALKPRNGGQRGGQRGVRRSRKAAAAASETNSSEAASGSSCPSGPAAEAGVPQEEKDCTAEDAQVFPNAQAQVE